MLLKNEILLEKDESQEIQTNHFTMKSLILAQDER